MKTTNKIDETDFSAKQHLEDTKNVKSKTKLSRKISKMVNDPIIDMKNGGNSNRSRSAKGRSKNTNEQEIKKNLIKLGKMGS